MNSAIATAAFGGVTRAPRQSPGRPVRTLPSSILAALIATILWSPADAFELPGPTALARISVGDGLSTTVRSLESTPAMLSNGTTYRLQKFYSSRWRDLSATFVTELTHNFGVFWGFKTGELGPKYHIQPALNLGFIYLQQVSPNAAVSIAITGIIGGWLKESPCIANYGAIGGIQSVNCRLASSALPPAQTLKYLLDLPPQDQVKISIRFEFHF